MGVILRIVGAAWILLTIQPVFKMIRGFLARGIHLHLGLMDFLTLAMLAGGIGLLLLKEWGRWMLLLGAIGFLVVLTGPALLHLHLGPVILRHLVFYGIFIALMLIPQTKAATR